MNLFLSLGLLLLSFSASAETIESTEYKYYEISPRSPYQIKPELMRRSPIRAGSGSFNGHTDWYIDWKFQSTPGPSGCKLVHSRTTVRVVHTLPVLSEYVTDKQTIEVFNKFNSALTQHELNHGKNGLSAAREMDKAFSEIPPQPDCRMLSRIVNDIGNSMVQKYAQKDNEYDRLTNNGETEGAVIY
jgi:predicted secreted Zn-dependent protease